MIGFLIFLLLSLIGLIASISQFTQKGPLLNNTYSDEDKKEKEKKPYYIQSGVIFLLISILFLTSAFLFLLERWNLSPIMFVEIGAIVLYTIISSIHIHKR